MRLTGGRPHRHWRLALLIPLLLLAACAGASGAGKQSSPTSTARPLPPVAKGIYFATYDQSAVNGQQSATNETIVALNPADGSVRWKVPTPQNTNLVATERAVYVLGAQGVEALRASDGRRLWSHPGASRFLYGNGVVYAASCSGSSDAMCALSALDGLTGATHWTTPIRLVENVPENITLAGSNILIFSETLTSQDVPASASLSVLDAGTGKLLWNAAVNGKGFEVAAWHGDHLYLLQESDTLPETARLQAVRLSDGSQLWETGNIQQYQGVLDTDSARIYMQTNYGMQALNEADGSVAWTYTAPGLGAGASALANNVVYMPVYSGTLVALDAATGTVLSSAPLNYAQVSSPVVANGLIYVNSVSADGSHTATYSALDTTAHFALRWTYPGIFDRPTVASGTLFTTNYAPTTAPSVYAFNATSGALLWKYDLGHLVAYSATDTTLAVVD